MKKKPITIEISNNLEFANGDLYEGEWKDDKSVLKIKIIANGFYGGPEPDGDREQQIPVVFQKNYCIS